MNQNNMISQIYEEINLKDYVKVIIKRKFFIGGIFFIFLAAAIIFNIYSPKIYRTISLLQLGKLVLETIPETSAMIEDPAQVIARITGDVYGIQIRSKLGLSEVNYPKIKASNPSSTNLIHLSIESADKELAKKILEEINSFIIQEHDRRIKFKQDGIDKNLSLLEENINILKKDEQRINEKIGSLIKEQTALEDKVSSLQKIFISQQDVGTQFALFDAKEKLEKKKQEIEDRHLEINKLESQIKSIESQLNGLKRIKQEITPTIVVKSPISSENPISPRAMLNIVLAGILGIFLGIFISFVKEWWQKTK